MFCRRCGAKTSHSVGHCVNCGAEFLDLNFYPHEQDALATLLGLPPQEIQSYRDRASRQSVVPGAVAASLGVAIAQVGTDPCGGSQANGANVPSGGSVSTGTMAPGGETQSGEDAAHERVVHIGGGRKKPHRRSGGGQKGVPRVAVALIAVAVAAAIIVLSVVFGIMLRPASNESPDGASPESAQVANNVDGESDNSDTNQSGSDNSDTNQGGSANNDNSQGGNANNRQTGNENENSHPALPWNANQNNTNASNQGDTNDGESDTVDEGEGEDSDEGSTEAPDDQNDTCMGASDANQSQDTYSTEANSGGEDNG